jgi:tetratricopeptide (TPR) repeat protein
LLERARAAEKEERFREARDYYLQALDQRPRDERLREGAARMSGRLNDEKSHALDRDREDLVARAEQSEDVSETRRRVLAAQAQRGRELLRQKKFLDAAAVFDAVDRAAPHLELVHGELIQTRKNLEKLLLKGTFPSPRHAAAVEGVTRYLQGNWPSAAESLDRALKDGELPPDLAPARIADLAAFARDRRDDETRRARRKDLLARAQDAQTGGRLLEAQKSYQELLYLFPGDGAARDQLAVVRRMLPGVQETAREEIRRQEVPQMMAQGTRLYMDGAYADALAQFNQILTIDPDNADAQSRLEAVRGVLLARPEPSAPASRTDAAAAETAYRKGLLLYGNEDMDGAAQAFDDALRSNPTHTEARLALERLGRNSAKGARP